MFSQFKYKFFLLLIVGFGLATIANPLSLARGGALPTAALVNTENRDGLWQHTETAQLAPSRDDSSSPSASSERELPSKQLEGDILQWEQLLQQSPSPAEAVILHNNLAAAYRQRGQLSEAIAHWEAVIEICEGAIPESNSGTCVACEGQTEPSFRLRLVKALVDQAQAYISLGQSRFAIPQLQAALKQAEELQLAEVQAVATKALGNAYYLTSRFEKAIRAYAQSLQLATQLNHFDLAVAVLNNLSNTYEQRHQQYLLSAQDAKAEGKTAEAQRWLTSAQQAQAEAIATAQRAVEQSSSGSLSAVRARLQLMRLAPGSVDKAQVLATLGQLPASPSKIFLMIELARLEEPTSASGLLAAAARLAFELGDLRSASYAVGELAQTYAKHRQYEPALKLAQQAQGQAQAAMAFESLYQWQWLAGRIYRETGALEEAKTAYRAAVATLQDLRSQTMTAPESLQQRFREQVEPVYREFLELLLSGSEPQQIHEAITVFQQLQLRELQNFFGDPCVEVEPVVTEALAPKKLAILYSMILQDKTYLVLQLPDEVKSYRVDVPAQKLNEDILSWRFQLENIRLPGGYEELSQHLYNLLIRPLAEDLAGANPDTLVFVNDGLLRNVPMAALHDGQQFLVEKYPIEISLGFKLELEAYAPQSLDSLIFGLTEAVGDWPPLPNVGTEAENIQQVLGGEKYLDQQFTLARLKQEIQEDYSIVHLATHGQFAGTADNSYLIAYDERITLAELEQILARRDRPVTLLTLSACQTAAGNERSVLGMAGVAARAGVETTLGSLWYLNDVENVALFTDFYRNFKQTGAVAEDLRRAQLKQIANPYSHPSIWASVILVSNQL
ncbi:MAG: CHAT domain-containing protein [Cyanophyceae cyanobacterium]